MTTMSKVRAGETQWPVDLERAGGHGGQVVGMALTVVKR